jgi:hypothetical protein
VVTRHAADHFRLDLWPIDLWALVARGQELNSKWMPWAMVTQSFEYRGCTFRIQNAIGEQRSYRNLGKSLDFDIRRNVACIKTTTASRPCFNSNTIPPSPPKNSALISFHNNCSHLQLQRTLQRSSTQQYSPENGLLEACLKDIPASTETCIRNGRAVSKHESN